MVHLIAFEITIYNSNGVYRHIYASKQISKEKTKWTVVLLSLRHKGHIFYRTFLTKYHPTALSRCLDNSQIKAIVTVDYNATWSVISDYR